MIGLAIEVSAATGGVALGDASGCDEIDLSAARGQARGLAPAIHELLARRGLAPGGLDFVVVGLGPGGYTGVRLGLATAKALAVALKRPIVGIASTEILAARPEVPAGAVTVALDARRGLVYVARYEKAADGTPHPVLPPALESAAEAAAGLPAGGFVAGDGLAALRGAAGGGLAGDAALAPRAREALRLGLAQRAAGRADDERGLLPLYLRVSEAERLWEQREQDGGGSATGARQR